MISVKEIRKKAERRYLDFLKDLVDIETNDSKNLQPFQKIIIRGDKSYNKSSYADFRKELSELQNYSKEKKTYSYSIDFKTVRTRSSVVGKQDLPVSIYFESEKDFLKFLNKEKEASLFKEDIKIIIKEFPELKEWIIKNPKKIIDNHATLNDILKVCHYFKTNPKPNLYIRELPIQVHTKFIENNKALIKDLLNIIICNNINQKEKEFEKRFNLKYSEVQIRFKILDKEISQKYFSGLDDIAIPVSQFEKLQLPLKRILVVENKTTLYTTLTLPKMEKTVAIFGRGYGVVNLKNTNWLNNVELLYWGDIDAQGFEILSQFRGYFNSTKSIFMDEKTFEKFYEGDSGTISKVLSLSNLTPEEERLYHKIRTNNMRLEQEKIPLDYVKEYFTQ